MNQGYDYYIIFLLLYQSKDKEKLVRFTFFSKFTRSNFCLWLVQESFLDFCHSLAIVAASCYCKNHFEIDGNLENKFLSISIEKRAVAIDLKSILHQLRSI